MIRKVAFFDIDGVLFRSSLLIELVEALVAQKVFPEDAKSHYHAAYVNWRNRTGTYEAYIGKVVESYMEHIKGVHYGTLADIGKQVIDEHGQHVYRYTRDLIASLKDDLYVVVAISQSPKTILDEFCTNYGFDKVYGRMYEIGPEDRFTGAMIDAHLIENKANIVARVFEQFDITKVGSMALGDTEGDITLLESVEKPICFNPNRTLFEHAKRRNWPIVVERKDVIYEL